MNFNCLDSKALASIGIRFRTAEETKAFADIILEELEVRIGEEISKRLTDRQLEAFDRCRGPVEARRWLDANCPEHRHITETKKEEFEQEIIKYRDQVPGVISCLDNTAIKTDEAETEPHDEYSDDSIEDFLYDWDEDYYEDDGD